MSDLKNILKCYENAKRLEDWHMFWQGNIGFYNGCELQRDILYPLLKQDLGLFFWERGGKQFVLDLQTCYNKEPEFNDYFYSAQAMTKDTGHHRNTGDILNAHDFLDALGCLGEDKIKELIEAMK